MEFKLTKLSGSAAHSAFTDLHYWQGHLYCCFREAQDHISKDGRVAILQLDRSGTVISKTYITEPLSDLRDPKLSVTPDQQLMLLAYQRKFTLAGSLSSCQPVVYLSSTGKSWSGGKRIGHNYWWLWRLRWHTVQHATSNSLKTEAYGFAYNRQANSIQLYAGNPLKTMNLLAKKALSLKKHKLGYPNESDLVFNGKQAWAIVRRDADSCTAQLGTSCWPFKRWQWHDLGIYLGGPCMIQRDNNRVWLAGRIWKNARFTTALFSLELNSRKLNMIAELPSAGDNSYPGLVVHENTLWVSYYSSHEDQKSQIYLAKLDLKQH